ncbi:MAG: hypothetical protein AB7O96_14055 [Pseudobdellovibrionaceae bacterium]
MVTQFILTVLTMFAISTAAQAANNENICTTRCAAGNKSYFILVKAPSSSSAGSSEAIHEKACQNLKGKIVSSSVDCPSIAEVHKVSRRFSSIGNRYNVATYMANTIKGPRLAICSIPQSESMDPRNCILKEVPPIYLR